MPSKSPQFSSIKDNCHGAMKATLKLGAPILRPGVVVCMTSPNYSSTPIFIARTYLGPRTREGLVGD